jgi:hypothetical protein
MFNKIKFAGVALTLMLAAGSAQAAIIKITAQTTADLDNMVTFANPFADTFTVDGTDPRRGKDRAGIYEGITGNKTATYASPFAQATNDGDSPFTNGTFTALRKTTATYRFDDLIRTDLSLLWGTPGSTGSIELFLGDVLVFTITGNDVNAVRTAAQSAVTNLSFLVSISDVKFDRAVFKNTGSAFEYANFATSSTLAQTEVSAPASGLLLLTGIGAAFFLRRKKS